MEKMVDTTVRGVVYETVGAVDPALLATGAERLIRPPHGSFDGTLSAALDGVALFSGSAGLSAYSQATGGLLWRRRGAVLQGEDLVRNVLYVSKGSGLTGLNPRTGATVRGTLVPAASSRSASGFG